MMIPGQELLPAAILGGVVVLVAGAAALHYFTEKKRRAAFAEAAVRLGMSYQAYDPELAGAPFARLPIFGVGRSRAFSNVLRGAAGAGAEQWVFDYTYTTGSGKNRHTVRLTAAAFRDAELKLPAFELRPENILHKVGGLFGYQDIDFEASPGFSSRYLLRGKDEPAVRGLFDAAVLSHFELHPGWRVEGDGEWLVALRDGRRVEPEDLRAFLDETRTTFCAFRNR